MALLRLLPSTSPSSIQQQFFFTPTTPFRPSPKFISLSTFPRFISISLTSQTPNFLPFCLSSTTQVEAPTTIDSDADNTTQEKETVAEDGALKTRLIAQNVPWTLTVDDVRSLFEKYGTIVDIELTLYSKTRNRGLAFVSMSSHEEAQTALNNLQSYEIEGRTLVLDWAKPRKERPSPPEKEEPSSPDTEEPSSPQTEDPSSPITKEPSSAQKSKPPKIFNLFVGNLPYQARTKDLKEFFISENANIVSAIVIFKAPAGSSGYGFVSFNTQEEANAALEAFQGKMFMGRPLRLERSKRFAKPRTKTNIRSGKAKLASNTKSVETAKVEVDATVALNPEAEEIVKVDEA